MKVRYKEVIDGHTIIKLIAKVSADSEATKEKIAPMITPKMTEKDVACLYEKNKVYPKFGSEADMMKDEEAKLFEEKLEDKGARRLLLENGEYIADFRSVEYHIKKAGKWKKEKIQKIGVTLPTGAVLPENLTKEQHEEIPEQQRAEQIAAMSLEDRARAGESELEALADEASRLEKRAEIQGKTFDTKAWYEKQAKIIKAKYQLQE